MAPSNRTNRWSAPGTTDAMLSAMDCWHCRRTAVGTCRFCGRGICENHVKTHPYILDLWAEEGRHRALIVEDALFCGTCRPRPDPLDLPEMK